MRGKSDCFVGDCEEPATLYVTTSTMNITSSGSWIYLILFQIESHTYNMVQCNYHPTKVISETNLSLLTGVTSSAYKENREF